MDAEFNNEKPVRGRTQSSRSERSQEFETFWRSLPRNGLLPHRRDIKPSRATSLLRDIVMVEARVGEKPSLRLRLIGSAIRERVQADITGADYLDFRPNEYRNRTVEFARTIVSRPCGMWEMLPMHYARGFAQNFEITAFPVVGDETPLLICLMNPLGGLVQPTRLKDQPVLADSSTVLQFIDIGAGKPSQHFQ
jgi:hypothetical protein